MVADRLALYTTVYPGVQKYLPDWYRSVRSQTDQDFDLWVGLDTLTPGDVGRAVGSEVSATWVQAEPGSSPAAVRQNALERIVDQYSAVVLVDSDDLLYPARVERARKALQTYEVAGCALSIIDEMGRSLGTTFGPPAGASIEALLPSYNIFGMSNSAYRSEVLKACLPIPPNCVLVDWLLATRAWAHGASMNFDAAPGMAYRQYGANTARVVPPFTEQQVLEAARRVLNHYEAVMSIGCWIPVDKLEQLQTAQRRAETFMTSISRSARTLHNYVQALNGIPPLYIWWWCVAHPELEAIWKS